MFQRIFALLLIILLAVLIFTQDLNFFGVPPQKVVGKVIETKGLVLGKSSEHESFVSLSTQTPLLETFEIVTGFESLTSLQFGETFKILANSKVKLLKKANNYQVHLDRGSIERLGQKDNVHFFVENKRQNSMQIAAPSGSTITEIETGLIVDEPGEMVQPEANEKFQTTLHETMRLHQRFLEKCFIKLYERQEGGVTPGRILVRFTLGAKGRLTNVNIRESDFTDQDFHLCVTEVISRVHFKRYKGQQRTIDLPLQIRLPI